MGHRLLFSDKWLRLKRRVAGWQAPFLVSASGLINQSQMCGQGAVGGKEARRYSSLAFVSCFVQPQGTRYHFELLYQLYWLIEQVLESRFATNPVI